MSRQSRAGAVWGIARDVMLYCALAFPAAAALAQEPPKDQKSPKDLADLSIEDLMKIEITSVNRKERSLIDAPAAVTVIRGEDLRRMGVRSIAEAFRMVPGMQVARIDANKWAVSTRGFNDRFANKLQVLRDNRILYSPLFSGVFWERLDPMIEDIERIEVIRGPGAAAWGSNAVNGVINIITKKAKDAQGGLVVAGGGTEERAFASVRYGGKEGDDLFYSVFAGHSLRDESYKGCDDGMHSRAGIRLEWYPSDQDTISFQGGYRNGETRGIFTQAVLQPPYSNTYHDLLRLAEGFAIADWTHRFSDDSRVSLTLTLERTALFEESFEEIRDAGHFSFRHRFRPFEGHDVVWGAECRLTSDRIHNSFAFSLDPDHDATWTLSVFAQDEISPGHEWPRLALGSRFEYNPYTHFEFQPDARLGLTPGDGHFLWAAASRAVRMPSRAEEDCRMNTAVYPTMPLPTLVAWFGDHDYKSENLTSFELGYRAAPVESLSLEAVLFCNLYEDLRTIEPGAPFVEPPGAPIDLVMPYYIDNKMNGKSWGLEISAAWRVTEGLTFTGAYSLLRMNLDRDSDSQDPTSEEAERQSPRNQAYLRSSWNITKEIGLDAVLRYVDVVPGWDAESYVDMDARLGWNITPDLEISITGQNLLHRRRRESGPTMLGNQSSEIQRGVYLSLSWRF